MKKLIKTLISIILVLILLFIIAGVCLVLFLDPNKFKGQISSIVQEKTGRNLVINGNIERSFFPWLGLRIHDVRMSNAPGFEPQENFVTVGEADISVKLMPLLSGNIEIGKLALKDLQLNLAENKQGKTNWQDLAAATAAAGRQSDNSTTYSSATPSSAPEANHKPTKFSIVGVEVENASIFWVNQKNGQEIKLSELNLTSQQIGLNKAFPLSLKFVLQSNQPAMSGGFALDSNVTLDPQQANYRLDKLRFSANLSAKAQPPVQLQAESVIINLKQQTLSIANALLSAANLTAKTNLEGSQILGKPQFNGRIDIDQFNLRDFLKAFGKNINTQDPGALQRAALSANFVGNGSSMKLSSIAGRVDDSTLQGEINISSFANKAINFAVNLNQLNLDRYLPSKSAPVTASSGAIAVASASNSDGAKVASSAAPSGKYAALQQANIDGTVQIGTLEVSKTQLTQLMAHLLIKNGIVQINPLTANVYQGTTRSQITADLRGAVPRITLDEKLADVQVNQLTKSDRLTGTANITAHLTMQGDSQAAIMRSLNGTTQFNIQNGALLGVDLPYELDRAAAMIKKQPGPSQPSTGRTDFGQFSGTGVFQNGVFQNNDLLMQSSQIKITGNGTANLVTQGLNYHLSAQEFNNPVFGQTALPLLVTGTFSKPIITPDIQAVARTLLQSGIKTRLEEHLGPRGGLLLHRLLEGR